jgi:hypothetical protein
LIPVTGKWLSWALALNRWAGGAVREAQARPSGNFLLDGASSASGLPSAWGLPIFLDGNCIRPLSMGSARPYTLRQGGVGSPLPSGRGFDPG